MTSSQKPLIVSFVSGKGGVGKTMLAVAFAKELSLKQRTLLLDLDFFNRGLTGLMRHGKDVGTVGRPPIFGSSDAIRKEPQGAWKLREVAHNLFHVSYPDLSQEEIGYVEAATIADLRSGLTAFLHDVAAESQCEVIVLDCHGGPDHLSFAACQVSQYSLLVSEPDKITFYGTLHFVRQLELSTGESETTTKPDLRLVFNKVVPAFSVNYVTSFYDLNIKKLFADRPLLPVFPLELYLTKEFEKTPFLTQAYPFSLLARKMRLLIFDLLNQSHPEKLARPIRLMPWPSRFYSRYSMGKIPLLLNVNTIMAVIAIGAVIFYLFTLRRDQWVVNSYVPIGRSVEELELILQFQHHPEILPADCRNKSLELQPDCFVQHHKVALMSLRSPLAALSDSGPKEPEQEMIRTLRHRPDFLAGIVTGEAGYIDFKYIERIEEVSTRLDRLRGGDEVTKNPDPKIRAIGERLPTLSFRFRVMYSLALFIGRYSELLLALAAGWFLSAVLLSWSGELDKRFTYWLQLESRLLAILLYLIAFTLWAPWTVFSGTFAKDNLIFDSSDFVVFGLLMIPILIASTNQIWKASLEIWLERKVLEGALRFVFVLYVFSMVVGITLFKS